MATEEELKKILQEVIEKNRKEGKTLNFEEILAQSLSRVDVVSAQEHHTNSLKTNPFNPEVLNEIKTLTKSIRSKMLKRDTKPQVILDFLFKLSAYATNDHYMRSVADSGVMDVLYLLATHPNTDIQYAAVHLLGEIAVNKENSQRMMKEGAVSLALRALDSSNLQTRIFAVYLCGNCLLPEPTCVSLAKFLMKHPKFLKNMLAMNKMTKPIDIHAVNAIGFVKMPIEPCLTSMQIVGSLCNSPETTKIAEDVGLIDDLLSFLNSCPPEPSQRDQSICSIAFWSIRRAYAHGLSRLRSEVDFILRQTRSIPKKSEVPAPTNQIEFTLVEAPIFQYEVVSDRVEIQNPKEALTKKCALLSCEVRESSTTKLKVCSGCKISYYCCREHQVQDWKEGHKQRCANLKS